MFKEKYQKYNLILIIIYFVLNIFNTYFLTSQLLNRYISPLPRTVVGELTSLLGNFSFLFLIFLVTIIFVKTDRNRQKILLGVTIFLNIFILLSGYYTYFYSTVFTTNSLEIFKNPSEGVTSGLFTLALIELFVYYRIVVLFPAMIITVLHILYNKEVKKYQDITNVNYTFKIRLSFGIALILITLLFNASYVGQINRKDSFNIKSLSGTRGVQNYGVYPYYIAELLGIDFDPVSRESLNINSDQQLYDAYMKYNKNRSSYTNFIDDKTYSNNLSLNESVVKAHPQLNLNADDSLTGIFEGKDLVLVHLESLNYFLWEIPEVRENFVFLNELFKESVVFENYYTSVGMGVSADAEASVLTGLYMNGYSTLYRDFENKNFQFDTLPKLFSEKDYRSLSIHADFKEFYNRTNAYKNLIGFTDDYYALEEFAAADGFNNAKAYMRYRQRNGWEYNNIIIRSPWPSEFEVNDVMYRLKSEISGPSMMFPVYLTQHTPYLFNPYEGVTYNIKNYDRLQTITKRYLEYAPYLDDLIKSTFFDPKDGSRRIDTNTVYVFYSDHGSGLNNGDLGIIFNNNNMSILEERRMIQQTISFIYAPSDEIDIDTGLNKGLITGTQSLTRSHIDLYRTVGDLFNLFDDSNPYFGVHGLSTEPTFAFDNRIQDVIIDNIKLIGEDNYKPYIVSFRNNLYIYPNDELIRQADVYDNIKRFKKLSDLLLSDDTVYRDFKKALQNN